MIPKNVTIQRSSSLLQTVEFLASISMRSPLQTRLTELRNDKVYASERIRLNPLAAKASLGCQIPLNL